MRKRNFSLSIFLFTFSLLYNSTSKLSAQSAEFVATVSTIKVAQHNIFEIQFELRNGEGTLFQPPSFKDFKIAGGPSIGSSTMIINGVVSRSQSWSYSLLAIKPGKFVIPPATVVVGKKKLSTRPIDIEVFAQKDSPSQASSTPSKDQVLLIAETNDSEYYPGQQIILTYKLLFRENIHTVNTIAEDDYADFFIQHFPNFSRDPTIETLNGIQYTSRIIKSMALFAHQSGTYTIDPMIMNAGINAPFPGNQGFFTMRRIMDIQVASEPITINVLPLPPDAPETFSGAVGQYKMKLEHDQARLTTDDAFAFQLEITGNGDARRLGLPNPVSNGKFEIFEPKIVDDRVFDDNNVLTHIRKVSYHMIPEQPGDFTIYIPFTYFDPVIKQYKTITSDTMLLQVSQGTGIRVNSLTQSTNADEVVTLMPTGHVWLKDKFWISFPHLFLFSLLVAGSGYGLWLNHKRNGQTLISAAERIRLSAGLQAREQMDDLASKSADMSSTLFFEMATEIYYRFLSNRFRIPASELDETNLISYLRKDAIPDDLIHQAVHFFNQCLEVRYGGIPGGYSKEQMLQKCRELTDRLDI